MRTEYRRTLVIAAFVTSLLADACSKESSAGAPAPVPPLPPAALAANPAAPPGPDRAAMPPPSPAAIQALLGARAEGAPGTGDGDSVSEVPDERHTIAGTIVLPPATRTKVARGDVMFLAARRAGGPPGPGSMVAVQKLVATDFPMRFAISSRDAMIPGIPFEGQMSITVRVDKDGDAMTRRKGDVFGQVDNVKVGSHKVAINLDKIQTEDQDARGAGHGGGGSASRGPPVSRGPAALRARETDCRLRC